MTTPPAPAANLRPVRSRLLFVCMGNICRSPLAEGVFLHLARSRSLAHHFTIDSCGTGGWHAGELPDARARQIAARYGVRLDHRARALDPRPDLRNFDLLLAMADANLRVLRDAGADPAHARLIRDFDPSLPAHAAPHEVPDPYYGGDDGFDRVYHMLHAACTGLLDALFLDSHAAWTT